MFHIMDLTNPAHFASAYEEHRRGVFAAAYRVLGDASRADDVVQDVFMRVWRKPERFDRSRGELGTYLRLMARSRAIDLYREEAAAGRATDRLKVAVVDTPPREDARPAVEVEREESRAAVREALHELPPSQREAIVMAYWGGMTADEISRRIGVPLGTAKSRIRLGLTKLRTDFGPQLAA